MENLKPVNRLKRKTSGDTVGEEELRGLINDCGSAMESRGISPGTVRRFQTLFFISQVTGLLPIILTIIWSAKYYGGYGLVDPDKLFNYHPTLMVLSMVYLSGNSMLIYRFMRFKPKRILKLIHAIIHGVNILIISFAFYAVYEVHSKKGIPHFYSLHSWLGMTVLSAYTSQAIGSFLIFMFPGASDPVRKYSMPFHIFGGVSSLVLSICVICMGFTEKIIFSDKAAYAGYQLKGLMVNFIGSVLILHGSLVAWLLYEYEYKRKPLPSESNIDERPFAMDNN